MDANPNQDRKGCLAEIFVEVGAKVFVDDGTGRGVEHFQPARMMAIDEPVMTDPEPAETGKFLQQWLGIALRQGGEGGFRQSARLRSEAAQVVPHRGIKDDLNPQRRTGGRT